MTDEPTTLTTAEERAKEVLIRAERLAMDVVEKAKVAAEAVENSRLAQAELHNANYTEMIATALREVFTVNGDKDPEMKVILKRVPILCINVESMHETLKEIKENMISKAEFNLVRGITFGFVTLVVVAFVGALLSKVFVK